LSAAKRWVPWLLAYTGARIAEITQLRKEDVKVDGDIHFIRITPDAGSVKTGEFRDVPLHPHLIELGFLEFVSASDNGPLFYSKVTRKGRTHPSKQVAGRVSEWVRSLGVVAANVKPSHGWRHRFKTIGLEVGMNGRVLDAIQGHAPRTAGDAYGDVTLKAKWDAIKLLPRYSIETPSEAPLAPPSEAPLASLVPVVATSVPDAFSA
jgi:integrase